LPPQPYVFAAHRRCCGGSAAHAGGADGNGSAAAQQFATLSTGLALTNADFIVV